MGAALPGAIIDDAVGPGGQLGGDGCADIPGNLPMLIRGQSAGKMDRSSCWIKTMAVLWSGGRKSPADPTTRWRQSAWRQRRDAGALLELDAGGKGISHNQGQGRSCHGEDITMASPNALPPSHDIFGIYQKHMGKELMSGIKKIMSTFHGFT